MTDTLTIEIECENWQTVMHEDVFALIDRKDVVDWSVSKGDMTLQERLER